MGHRSGLDQARNDAEYRLQRWQQEAMTDQPYHNLDSVKRQEGYRSDDRGVKANADSSSVGYCDPRK